MSNNRILHLRLGVLVALQAVAFYCLGQDAPFRSFEILTDGRVTFHYKDSGAKSVLLNVDTLPKPIPMANSSGVSSATTPALPLETYWYSFNVDGHDQLDPYNKVSLPNYLYYDSVITVPGSKPQPWEVDNIPHGSVHHHFYTSARTAGPLTIGSRDLSIFVAFAGLSIGFSIRS